MNLIATITIPGRTPSQNSMRALGTWAERKAKHQWRRDAAWSAKVAVHPAERFIVNHNPGSISKQPVKRRIVLTSFRMKLLDNAAESLAGGACKHIVDGLVDAGVLVDDSEKWCEREYRQVCGVTDANERLEIEVWE